ncbi:hypothetical protein M441DRAFT_217476 [Trichoderma asperellum CBS 433.97]|uniref:Uncharacterized protein n=1 Tax=Trichoderma asperellum (strain ATCC 204424 / CBS 433.97 / NBRC 101777) TaxID=1042311 RepID=A0A2T3ZNT6_TRIA4|nr:hypothetical protein M441DRAFT_217476 [Trichoderma asperellum CBS 433.97]PTB46465.1 hypothetical protein M441DRAFT_217476 [Trichoderma asperellum CBS 433.97]
MAKALHLLAKRLDSYLKPGAVRLINRGSSALCGQVWCVVAQFASLAERCCEDSFSMSFLYYARCWPTYHPRQRNSLGGRQKPSSTYFRHLAPGGSGTLEEKIKS